jgi:uncharacterized membrane protein YkvA (DUF1232 family)
MKVKEELGKYEGRATRILNDKSKLSALLDAATEKIIHTISDNQRLSDGISKIKLILRMVKAYASGSYREVPWKALLSFVGGLIYFITPTDLIPDFIPVVGMLDDITVILWLFRSFSDNIRDFEEWERSRAIPITED